MVVTFDQPGGSDPGGGAQARADWRPQASIFYRFCCFCRKLSAAGRFFAAGILARRRCSERKKAGHGPWEVGGPLIDKSAKYPGCMAALGTDQGSFDR